MNRALTGGYVVESMSGDCFLSCKLCATVFITLQFKFEVFKMCIKRLRCLRSLSCQRVYHLTVIYPQITHLETNFIKKSGLRLGICSPNIHACYHLLPIRYPFQATSPTSPPRKQAYCRTPTSTKKASNSHSRRLSSTTLHQSIAYPG